MAGKRSEPSSGPPRWTYALGAIVGAIAVGWPIVNHFIAKPEPLKPAAQPTTNGTTVVVTGNGTGVGTMSGGTINVGNAVSAPASSVVPKAASAP